MRTKNYSIINDYSKEELQAILDESNSLKDAILKIGFKALSSNYKTLNKYIKLYELSLDRLNQNYKKYMSSLADKSIHKTKLTAAELLIENCSRNRTNVKNFIIKNKLINYQCAECGLKDIYNKKKISLQLDHINGINNDNRLENLRFLCPNCHSQTNNFSGKTSKEHKKN